MRPVVGIFAHPDDEVFFTGGTLAQFAKERDVYTICVTDGSEGQNSSDDERNLGEIRKEELLASAKVLGIKETFFLDYKDGTLSNNVYHEVADKIKAILEEIQPEIIMTFELRGVSGHLDHIAIAMITSYVFEHLETIKELWYFCNIKGPQTISKDYYIFWPPAYERSEVSKIVDVSDVWDKKVEAMMKHASQMHDVKNILAQYPARPKEEYFIIVKQSTKDME